ncbi:MAG: RHS repeat-associated core domain-containing protein, partial [Bdellovibrio sp.]|nr:RHS repeat-associated core domain-containing protein [Bdellovibrio sp.]
MTLSSFGYARDAVGNRIGITTLDANRTLAYDDNNQLLTATNPAAANTQRSDLQSESFTYDSIYNRKTDQGGSFSYDPQSQRLNEDYNFNYFYDNNGNLFKKQAKAGFPNSDVTNFSYSSENQLMGVLVFAGGVSQPTKEIFYTYDALGRRIQKRVMDHSAPNDPIKSFTRRYVYDGQEILLEYDGSNNLLARYTHSTLATDDVLSVHVTSSGVSAGLAQASGSYQYLKDGQGTITEVASNSGSKIQRYLYSAFGILLGIQDANAADITANPVLNTSYGFTGRERDSESGYMYYRARYYDPNTGRFLQKDPNPGQQQNPVTVVNGTTYCGNSPQGFEDPSGAIFGIDDLLLIGILAALGGTINSAQKGWSWEHFLSGALTGASIGAATIGVADIFNGISWASQSLAAGDGIGLGALNFAKGFMYADRYLAAEYLAGSLGAIAGVGLFDPSAGDFLKSFGRTFIDVGSISFVTQIAVGVGLNFYSPTFTASTGGVKVSIAVALNTNIIVA